MIIYAVACSVIDQNGNVVILAGAYRLQGKNEAEAEQVIMDYHQKKYPPPLWSDHQISLIRIPHNLILQAASEPDPGEPTYSLDNFREG